MADVSILNNGVSAPKPIENEVKTVSEEPKKIEEVNKVNIEIPEEKKDRNIIQTSREGDTLSISETADKLRQLKDFESEPVEVKPVKVETPKVDYNTETTDTTDTTDVTDDIESTDTSSDNLSNYTEIELKRMLDRGEITTKEYNLEIASRKASGTLKEAETEILETEEKLAEVEATDGQGVENLVNGNYGTQKS